jgi:membrane-associated phospholipid phosphatase
MSSEGNDLLLGTPANDQILGFQGNDTILGLSAGDLLFGNQGADLIFGNQDSDTLCGGQGNDTLHGGKGNDLVSGDKGDDTICGDLGADTLTGGDGNDRFLIGKGSETDFISDFGKGQDLIELTGNLTFDSINIVAGTGTNAGNTILQNKTTNQIIAVLQGFDSSTISKSNFLPTPEGDAVLDWNQTLLNAVKQDKTAPPLASRNMAMVHAAIYDAVNAIEQTGKIYRVEANAPESASAEAAAAAAAHRVLVNLYPQQTATFDTALQASLAEIPDGVSETDGVNLGQSVADEILQWRSTDGANATVQYTPGTNPGEWQPTPPGFAPALLPQWPNVTPFAMTNGEQFRPAGPPALDSEEYSTELNLVKQLGSSNSTERTAEQTEIAQFWADGGGTYTPPGHWNEIAQDVSLQQGSTLAENARLFALLNIAMADAGIIAWDAKYTYNFWRPITAIQQADSDGNPQTASDPNWTPLLTTPPFPEYISGHSTFSGAADAILTSFFGENINFTTESAGLPGVRRSFESFTQAASEAGISRIYGGIHFASANEDGLAAGRALGEYVFDNFLGSNI